MNDLKDKFGEGLGKIQGGIDTGRKKLETTKELFQLRRTLKELMGEKGRLYFRIGQRAHLLSRQGAVRDEDLTALGADMAALDAKIRSVNREIAAAGAEGSTRACPKCGEAVAADARFCMACGGEVGAPEPDLQPCAHCVAEIPAGARYCPFCGGPAGGPA